ncbi:hypothetical protein ACHQM5_020009 [Ranunculus cassubicifolius]
MGFDNECILNIQSLAGEYFCPVCRLLVYPNEALQSQCTHLYCKPCLSYVVSTTRACPYDGYLVTEADSKPLGESNKTLADTIGKIAVHCLYHRSGCTWQGQLSECITHCTGCAFGNSPVVCNRCSTQIVHRQVQEHAQNCPGVQPQAQQAEGSQNATTSTGATTSTEQNQATAQVSASATQTQAVQTAVVPASGQDQTQANTTSQPQTAVQAVPTPEQWYQQQQQYQQYYQQYPGYDPYQQQQQYGAYQPGYQQYPQQYPTQSIPGQQPQMYMQQPQPQPQIPIRPQAQPQAQTLPQVQPQPQPHSQPQPAHQQAQVGLQPQVQSHANMPNPLQPSHAYPQQPQAYSQPQPHQTQPQVQHHFQQRPQLPPQQQPNPQHPQPHQQTYPYPQSQPMVQTQLPQPQAQLQARPQTQPHHPSQAVSGHQSYPQPHPNQQLPPGPPQLQSVHMHSQQQGAPTQMPQPAVQMQPHFPQQQIGQMRPPHSHVPMQQQQPAMLPQGQRPNAVPAPMQAYPQQQTIPQYPGMHPTHQQSLAQQSAHGQSLHPQAYPGQPSGMVQSTQQPAPFIQQQAVQAQLRPQAPSSVLSAGSHAQQQFQQNVSISHGQQSHQSQNYPGRAVLPNQGMPHQPFQSSTVGSSADAKMTQPGGNLPYPPNIRPQSSTEQQPGYVNLPPQSSNDTSTHSYGSNMQVSSVKSTMSDIPSASQLTDVKEANESKSDCETQVMDGDKKSIDESEGKSTQSKSDVKEISESQALQKDTSSSQDGLDEPVVKNMLREEVSGQPESSASGLLPETGNKQDDKSQLEDKEVQEDVKRNLSSQKTEIPNGSDEKVSIDLVGSQRKVLVGQMQDRVYAQSGHVVSVSDNQQLQPNYGHSHTQAQVTQRPLQPDQLPPLNSHPQQMQIPGPPPTHLRPQGNSLHGSVPLQGPPSNAAAHFQQPFGQSLGPFHPEISSASGLGPGSIGRGPGPSQGNLNVGPMPAHYAGGNPAGGPPFGGPPPGSFDSQGHIMGRMPPQGMQMPDADFVASKRPGYFDGRLPDLLPGSVDRIPIGQPPIMQLENGGPARGPASGVSNPSYPLNLQEERFKHFPEDRYRQFPEGGFNLPGGERLGNFPAESVRRDISQREFLEDLKRFPRPGHLDSTNNPKSDNYFSSSRPLDRAPHGFSSEARGNLDVSASSAPSRLLPPYHGGGFLRDDNSGRKIDHGGAHPDFQLPISESRFRMRSPGREYSDIPLNRFRSIEDDDGRAFGERSKPFGVHPDSNPYFERRFPLLPSHLRRGEFDTPGNSRIGDRVHLRGGDFVGPDILQSSGPLGPRNLHIGEPGGYGTFQNPSRMGDMPLNSRPGFNANMLPSRGPSDAGFFNAGEAESLDHSRKRKHGSMGWCRICKVDCETIEGLEMHSQTRDHQKMAMDMVLNIKKDNAKKQKVSSEEHISHEGDANKSRKASINNQEE